MTYEFLKKTGRAVALSTALVAAGAFSMAPTAAEAAWHGGGHGGWHGARMFRLRAHLRKCRASFASIQPTT